jgi:hypothetical protein
MLKSITRTWLRRLALAAVVLGVTLPIVACDDDDNETGPSAERTFNQVQRLGNPLVSEVFLDKRDHPWHASVGPEQDVTAFTAKVKGFAAAFGRSEAVQSTLATVLLPDMLIVQTDRDPATAGWLTWALADGYGGRRLQDDVVDAGLSAIFGKIIDASGAPCDNFQLPLCTDNVGPHSYDATFPYLKPPR